MCCACSSTRRSTTRRARSAGDSWRASPAGWARRRSSSSTTLEPDAEVWLAERLGARVVGLGVARSGRIDGDRQRARPPSPVAGHRRRPTSPPPPTRIAGVLGTRSAERRVVRRRRGVVGAAPRAARRGRRRPHRPAEPQPAGAGAGRHAPPRAADHPRRRRRGEHLRARPRRPGRHPQRLARAHVSPARRAASPWPARPSRRHGLPLRAHRCRRPGAGATADRPVRRAALRVPRLVPLPAAPGRRRVVRPLRPAATAPAAAGVPGRVRRAVPGLDALVRSAARHRGHRPRSTIRARARRALCRDRPDPRRVGHDHRGRRGLGPGVPVVSTSRGVEGLDAHDGDDVLVADDPAEFAARCSMAARYPDLRGKLAANGRARYEAEFTWPLIGAQLADWLTEAPGGGKASQNGLSYVGNGDGAPTGGAIQGGCDGDPQEVRGRDRRGDAVRRRRGRRHGGWRTATAPGCVPISAAPTRCRGRSRRRRPRQGRAERRGRRRGVLLGQVRRHGHTEPRPHPRRRRRRQRRDRGPAVRAGGRRTGRPGRPARTTSWSPGAGWRTASTADPGAARRRSPPTRPATTSTCTTPASPGRSAATRLAEAASSVARLTCRAHAAARSGAHPPDGQLIERGACRPRSPDRRAGPARRASAHRRAARGARPGCATAAPRTPGPPASTLARTPRRRGRPVTALGGDDGQEAVGGARHVDAPRRHQQLAGERERVRLRHGAGTAVPVSTHASVIAASWAAERRVVGEDGNPRQQRVEHARRPMVTVEGKGDGGEADAEWQPWFGLGVGGQLRRSDRAACHASDRRRRACPAALATRLRSDGRDRHQCLGVALGRVGIAVEQGDEAVPHRGDRREQPAVAAPRPKRGPRRGRRRSRPRSASCRRSAPSLRCSDATPRGAASATAGA